MNKLNEYQIKELAETWQIYLLRLNQYEWTKVSNSPKIINIDQLYNFNIPDDLNEIINFHFSLYQNEKWNEKMFLFEDLIKVSINIWIYHPGLNKVKEFKIQDLKRNDLNKIIEVLKKAQKRNKDRFDKIEYVEYIIKPIII